MAEQRRYPVSINQRLDINQLALLSEEQAETGEEDGLEGNRDYRDLRGMTWSDVAEAIQREEALFERFEAAIDLDGEAELFAEERGEALQDADELWGLDIGVAAAAIALSVLGATTVNSCNAGGFGGRHVAAFPYVAFFLPVKAADELVAIAVEAHVGLDMTHAGILRLFGQNDFDLHRFAKLALKRHQQNER